MIIIDIKLSFEKFLSKYSPSIPTKQSKTVYGPIIFPTKQSSIKPKVTPNNAPILFPTKSPISRIIPTNKLGEIPLIVNHEKRLTCKKYVIKNDNRIINIAFNFFKKSPPMVYELTPVITRTLDTVLKLIAVSIKAYLSVKFLVFTICDTVPIIIPLG